MYAETNKAIYDTLKALLIFWEEINKILEKMATRETNTTGL